MQDCSYYNDTCCSVYSDEYMSSSGYTYYANRQQRRRAKNESGRSMVEMLGVLAIIGVLSVAGIAGFSTAMAKHKANEIANSVSGANVTMQAGQGVSFIDVPGITFESKAISGVGDNAYISVDLGDNKAICKQLKIMFENSKDWQFFGNCD